jgi:hypothetical protein
MAIYGLGAASGGWSISPLNPAIGLATITFSTFNGKVKAMQWAWIFFTFAWLGSLLAVLMFECGFKRASRIVNQEEGEEARDEVASEEIVEAGQPLME